MRSMRRCLAVWTVWGAALGLLVASAPPAAAADSPVGNWVKKSAAGKPEMTMTIEAWGNSKAKLTYHVNVNGTQMVLTVAAALDGSDAPLLLNGKPSGETMAIKMQDKHHSMAVLKMNGKKFGTSKGTFSDDFKTFNVENEFSESVAGNTAGKSTETWTRQ